MKERKRTCIYMDCKCALHACECYILAWYMHAYIRRVPVVCEFFVLPTSCRERSSATVPLGRQGRLLSTMATTSLAVVCGLTSTVLYTVSGLRFPKYTRTRLQLLGEIGTMEGPRSPNAESWSDAVADVASLVPVLVFDCVTWCFLCLPWIPFCREPRDLEFVPRVVGIVLLFTLTRSISY